MHDLVIIYGQRVSVYGWVEQFMPDFGSNYFTVLYIVYIGVRSRKSQGR